MNHKYRISSLFLGLDGLALTASLQRSMLLAVVVYPAVFFYGVATSGSREVWYTKLRVDRGKPGDSFSMGRAGSEETSVTFDSITVT